MAMRQLAAQIPPRELAIAAITAGLRDWANSEIAKYCILRGIGYADQDAKDMILSLRKVASGDTDAKVIGVWVPEAWLDLARQKYPDLTPSELFRYSVARVSEPHEDALQRAKRVRGRPRNTRAANS